MVVLPKHACQKGDLGRVHCAFQLGVWIFPNGTRKETKRHLRKMFIKRPYIVQVARRDEPASVPVKSHDTALITLPEATGKVDL